MFDENGRDSAAFSTAASQQEGPGFQFQLGAFCEESACSPFCLRGLPAGTPASSHNRAKSKDLQEG